MLYSLLESLSFRGALAILQSAPRAKVKSTVVSGKVHFTSLSGFLKDFSVFYILASSNTTILFFFPLTFLP